MEGGVSRGHWMIGFFGQDRHSSIFWGRSKAPIPSQKHILFTRAMYRLSAHDMDIEIAIHDIITIHVLMFISQDYRV